MMTSDVRQEFDNLWRYVERLEREIVELREENNELKDSIIALQTY